MICRIKSPLSWKVQTVWRSLEVSFDFPIGCSITNYRLSVCWCFGCRRACLCSIGCSRPIWKCFLSSNWQIGKSLFSVLKFSNWVEEISLFLHWVLVMFTGHAVLWESRSRVMKCQMSLNKKCHEMYNVLKCKMLWNADAGSMTPSRDTRR